MKLHDKNQISHSKSRSLREEPYSRLYFIEMFFVFCLSRASPLWDHGVMALRINVNIVFP